MEDTGESRVSYLESSEIPLRLFSKSFESDDEQAGSWREVDILENRLLAIFDGPARAVRCAAAITEYTSRLGVKTSTGLHTGECEIVDGHVAGAAAQMCVCVANEAEPGEVLVSSTVKDLVAGSGINFEDRGIHDLAGCGECRLFSVRKGQP